MKTLKIIITIVGIIFPYFLSAQSVPGFTVDGHLDGLKDGEIVKLGNRFKDWHYLTWEDSCKVVNGSFHLEGIDVPEGPRYYEIYHYDYDRHGNETYCWVINLFVAEGQQIKISGKYVLNHSNRQVLTKPDIKVDGSPSTDALYWEQSTLRYADSVLSKIDHRLGKIKDSIGYDGALVETQVNAKLRLDRLLDSITQHANLTDKIAIPILFQDIIYSWSGYHGYYITRLYNSLSPEIKNSYYGKAVRNMAQLAIGQYFPTFILPDTNGNKIAMKDIVGKSKVTLVHFWASNSVDVDTYQRELRVMYRKYQNKGLNIIGISADTSVQTWKDYLAASAYQWVNVIAEPKGWGPGSLISDIYNEGGHYIPNTTNVLLDSKGKIIAWDVSSVELQYYLDKCLTIKD